MRACIVTDVSEILTGIQVIESIIVVDLDEEEKIVKLSDQWDGKLPTWFGSHFLRRVNAKVAPWFVHVPNK